MNLVKLLVLGSISGIVSFLAILIINNGIGIYFLPGLIFGLIIGFAIKRLLKKTIYSFCLFMFLSTIAYYISVFLFVYLIKLPYTNLIVAGVAGSAILLLAFHLISKITVIDFLLGMILGGLLSLSWFIIPSNSLFSSSGYGPSIENYLSLYLFWQSVMAVYFGYLVKKTKVY